MTQRQMHDFCSMLNLWAITYGDSPGATLTDALSAMSRDEEFGQSFAERFRECPLILEGKDAWGIPFIYRPGRLRSGSNGVVFRSCGRNGRDDNGQGDDIQVVVGIPASQPQPDTQPHGHERDNGAGSLLGPGSRPQQAQP